MARTIPPVERTDKAGFEIDTCGRCGGTGNYSFNLMHGSTCYGCGGTGVVLTKRGAVARRAYMDSLVKPVAEIAVGDSVYDDGMWFTITARSEPDAAKHGSVNGEPFGMLELSRKGRAAFRHGFTAGSTFRSVRDEAERLEKLAAAIALQSTLGKSGKAPAARKTKEAA